MKIKLTTLVALSCLVLVSSVHAAPLYTVTDLGTLGGATSAAYNVNDSGQVVGRADTATQTDAFLWSTSTGMVDLGTLGGNFARAENINDSGAIVGMSLTGGGIQHAMSYSYPGGPMVDQDGGIGLGGASIIYTVSDGGQFAGAASDGLGHQYARYYDGTSWTTLPTFGAVGASLARGVNDSGVVVGSSQDAGGNTHAYSWTAAGGLIDLGNLGGTFSQSNYINSSGVIVGQSNNASGFGHAFVYNGGVMTDLGTLGGNTSSALKIDTAGDSVGFAQNGSGTTLAFFDTGGTMLDLNTLTDSSGIGWTLSDAQGISENGDYIVGVGTNSLGQTDAFLLTLTPEPSTCAMLVGGLGLLGLMARRRRSD